MQYLLISVPQPITLQIVDHILTGDVFQFYHELNIDSA
jgi:hypothetical protein